MADEAHQKPHPGNVSVLPRQPCFSPRTAAAPPTTGGSGQGYRDLKAENKEDSSKRPGGDGGEGEGRGGGGKGTGRGRQPAKASHRRQLALPQHPQSPHAPSYTDRNRKTETLILGGTAAATFPTSPHTLAAGSPTTWSAFAILSTPSRPYHPRPPQLPHCTELLGAPGPHIPPSVLFMLSGPGSQDASGSILRASCQIWSPESLQGQASPRSTFITHLSSLSPSQLSVPRDQFSPKPLTPPHDPAPYPRWSPAPTQPEENSLNSGLPSRAYPRECTFITWFLGT